MNFSGAVVCCAAMLHVATASAQGLDLPGSTSPPPAQGVPGCTSVTVGSQVSYGCGGADVAAVQAQSRKTQAGSAISANSAAPRLGLYNQAATREQFGNQFGKSVVPQRPPPSVYVAPLRPKR